MLPHLECYIVGDVSKAFGATFVVFEQLKTVGVYNASYLEAVSSVCNLRTLRRMETRGVPM